MSPNEAASLVEELHARRGQVLWGYARRLGLSDAEASDAVQEAVMRLLSQLTDERPIADPEAWTFRVLHRLCMDEHRARRRLGDLAKWIRPVQSPDHAAGADVRIAVWSEVDRLPQRERAVLYLRYRGDLAFDQIGTVLGITAAGARAEASRGVARLRSRLAREEDK